MPNDVDCLVIGAGPAGLAAAEILHSAGARFTILEAANAIGGRAKSRPLPDGTVFERGAMVLHGLRVMTWESVVKHRLTTHGTYHREWYTGFAVTDGAWTHEPSIDEFEAGLEEVGAKLLDPSSEGRSLYDVVQECSSGPEIKDQMLGEFAQLVPLDPREVDAISAGEILQRESPRTALFELVEGYSELWSRMCEPFADRVRLNTHVDRVAHTTDGVVVTAEGDDFRAAAVIVTTSVGVLQAGAIEFSPPLPADKVAAINGLRMAPMIKIGALFQEAFWESSLGEAMSFTVPTSTHIDSWFLPYAQRGGTPLLLTLVGAGSEALTGDPQRLENLVRADLDAAFGQATVADQLVEIIIEDWPSDPLALGAGSVAPVGKRHLRKVLASPTPPVFWAGEACSTDGHAECIEGAISTGRVAAIEALHSVRAFKVRQPDSRLDWSAASE